MAAQPLQIDKNNTLTITTTIKTLGRSGPIAWPPKSPHLTPLDYFLWGYLKDKVCRTSLETLQEMEGRISANCRIPDEDMFTRVRESFEKRISMYMHEGGKQFEHLL